MCVKRLPLLAKIKTMRKQNTFCKNIKEKLTTEKDQLIDSNPSIHKKTVTTRHHELYGHLTQMHGINSNSYRLQK